MKFIALLFLSFLSLWADAHIFVYHRFNDSRHPSTNTTNEELRANFEFFKSNGYKVVPLHLLVETIKQKKEVPDNWVVLTIDDNYKSFYENGLPIFKEYGYPFSLFVFVEGTHKRYPDYTSWEDLKEIAKYGAIEFHSYGHKHLQKLSNEEIIKDFDKGMQLIQKHLGIKPRYFSYPYGEYTSRVKKLCEEYGFEAIINQNMGAVSEQSDVFDLDRTALVGKSDLNSVLKYDFLDATWEKPQEYPEDKTIHSISLKTKEKNAKHAKVYVSGYGWENFKLQDGLLEANLNKALKFPRSRIIINVDNKISSKLLIKDSYGTK